MEREMTRDAYLDALQEPVRKPRFCDDWPRDKIEAEIAKATEAMKGPMHNIDRIDANHYRKTLRERLAELDAAKSA